MKTTSELRGILFRHLDGITTAPTAYSLHKKGVLDYILQHQKVSLKELTKKFKANEGYLNVALRVLASQGWLLQNTNKNKNEISFLTNDKTSIAFSLVPLYEDVFKLMQFTEHFHPRKFEIEPFEMLNTLFQKFKSKFRITTNGGQCISCGNCSTYCEMGIDVRSYAQKGQNIVRASCVGCGICASVCPRGVLKLENGKEEGRINNNPISIGNNNITVQL